MKLIDLEATETRTKYDKVLAIGFSQETYDKLQPYRENREAAGFVRLAVGVLLEITSEYNNESLQVVVDELVASCETLEHLKWLSHGFTAIGDDLFKRMMAIEADQ